MRCEKRLPANEKAKKVITFGRSNTEVSVMFKHKKYIGSEVLILGNSKIIPNKKRLNTVLVIETFAEVLVLVNEDQHKPFTVCLDDL